MLSYVRTLSPHKAEKFNPAPPGVHDAAARKVLFGQDRSVVK